MRSKRETCVGCVDAIDDAVDDVAASLRLEKCGSDGADRQFSLISCVMQQQQQLIRVST